MKQNFIQFVNKAFELSMMKSDGVMCFYLGATDPKDIFRSAINLEKNLDVKNI